VSPTAPGPASAISIATSIACANTATTSSASPSALAAATHINSPQTKVFIIMLLTISKQGFTGKEGGSKVRLLGKKRKEAKEGQKIERV
jgi:hypothetical protein